MAWFYGTFSCGHEGRVNITGPTKNRQWIADRKFERLCPECYEKQLKTKFESERVEALEKAKEMELPELTGSEKQIAWAVTLRQKFIEKCNEFKEKNKDIFYDKTLTYSSLQYERGMKQFNDVIEKLKETPDSKELNEKLKLYTEKLEELDDCIVKVEDIVVIENYILNNFTTAKYFIDSRDTSLERILLANKKEALKSDEEKIKEEYENKLIQEIDKEATIYPENCKNAAAVRINADEKIITAEYEKNEDFRRIVKSLGYNWDTKQGVWEKVMTIKTGSYKDRAAELGNKLLNEGFPVVITDEEIREKAIIGEYENECFNWINFNDIGSKKYKNKFLISWGDFNTKLYEISKKMSSAIWSSNLSCMVVKLEHFEEVEEFARLYNFKFTDKAKKAIEEFKNQLNDIKTVNPKKVEEKETDGLQEILNSSTEILDDLIDED